MLISNRLMFAFGHSQIRHGAGVLAPPLTFDRVDASLLSQGTKVNKGTTSYSRTDLSPHLTEMRMPPLSLASLSRASTLSVEDHGRRHELDRWLTFQAQRV
jgi:hypothetical protein